MTRSCPAKVSADSGIDALTHAIEAYTAWTMPSSRCPGRTDVYQGKHPLGRHVAEKAITLVGKYLRRAVRNGNDLEAREGMALAATLGAWRSPTSASRWCMRWSIPSAAPSHCSHGAGNGLLFPYVMQFNLPAKVKTFAEIARLLGETPRGTDQADAENAIAAVEKLRNDIGVPDACANRRSR